MDDAMLGLQEAEKLLNIEKTKILCPIITIYIITL